MEERQFFNGSALNAIDGKGRVAIPPAMRAVIEANGGGRILCLDEHDVSPCLIGFDKGWLRLRRARIQLEEERAVTAGRGFDIYNANRDAFGGVEEVPFDASGRLIVPPFLRAQAQLEELALFYAASDWFEIWNPRVALQSDTASEKLKRRAMAHLQAKGLA